MRLVKLALALGIFIGPPCLAQDYRCDWSVVGIGGGEMGSAEYRCGATAGQTAAGPMAGTSFLAMIGFWQSGYEVGIHEETVLPNAGRLDTRLEEVSPNPCPGRAALRFALAGAGPVSLTVHDMCGRLVRTLAAGPRPAGSYSVEWRGDDDAGRVLANGVYFCRFAAGDARTTRKLVLAR
jgi:hypothetical protein